MAPSLAASDPSQLRLTYLGPPGKGHNLSIHFQYSCPDQSAWWEVARANVREWGHPMRWRDRFDRLRLRVKETSPSPTPSEMPINGFFRGPRGLKPDGAHDDVLRMLLVRDSIPRKRVLNSSADLSKLVMKRLMQNMARSQKTPAR